MLCMAYPSCKLCPSCCNPCVYVTIYIATYCTILGHVITKTSQTDQHIAVRMLTGDKVTIAASYEATLQFPHSCHYGDRHKQY